MNQGPYGGGQAPGYGPPQGYGPPGYPPPGYPPGPPPKKPRSALAIVLMIFGGLFVVGVGSCVVCVAVVAKTGSDVASPTAVEAGPARAEATFVPVLVQLAGNPKSIKPTDTTDDDGAGKPSKKDKNNNYEYSKPSGIPIDTLYLSVQKANPSAWELFFEEREMLPDGGLAKPTVSKDDFAPTDGLTKLPDPHPGVEGFEDYEITAGPLKGSFLQREGGRIEVMSLPFAINRGIQWVCVNRFPGARPESAFEDQCRDIARQKLLVPGTADFPGLFDGNSLNRFGHSTANCGWVWDSWVESKNAFNVTIRHSFHCEDDPATHSITFTME